MTKKVDIAVLERIKQHEQTKAKKPLVSFDYAIKYLLKDKGNYDILEGFISAVLATQNYKPVKIVALLDTESNKEQDIQKRSLADLVVEDTDHRKYIVEIERTSTKSFIHKSYFNVSRLVADQISKGMNYKTIKKIFHISLLYFPVGNGGSLYHGRMIIEDVKSKEKLTVRIKDKKSGQVYDATDVFPEYMYVPVPNFDDTISMDIDEWVYIMKHEKIREGCTLPYKDKVEDRLSLLKMSEAERNEYYNYMKKVITDEDAIETATDKGMEEGIKLGIAEGEARGEAKLKQAVAEAEAKLKAQKLEIAKNLLQANMDIKSIAKVTGLTAQEISSIQKPKKC